MSRLSEAILRDRFHALPRPATRSGAARRVGVEIEMAGLTERRMAELVAETLGGRIVEEAPYEVAVEDTAIGHVRCFLDTAFRKGKQHALSRLGLEIGREVIPVELATEPLPPSALPRLEALRETLRRAGAIGSRDGVFLSFGVHLNIEVAGEAVADWRPPLTAFALIEDWLRLADPIDSSRRLLPFVDPYPVAFVMGLLKLAPDATAEEVIDLYLRETPTRNRSLDMLPLFAHLDAARVAASAAWHERVGPRPAFHYRLPDSRIDEPGWRLAYEWNRWAMVERVAADPALLEILGRTWLAHPGRSRREWCAELERILLGAGLAETAA